MDDVRSSRLPLLACLAASVLIHAAIIASLVDPDSALASILRQTEEPNPPETRLGIDDSELVSIAWIGFSEATPHTAVKAETLQPELSADAVTAGARAADQALRRVTTSAAQASESLLERINEAADLVSKLQQLRDQATQAEYTKQSETPNEAEQTEQSKPVPPTKQAIQDDREADATTPEVTVQTSDLGKVLAREGLRIQTFRPKFDATTKQHELRAQHGSVTAVIKFTKNGSVLSASLKQGTESGQPNIDEPILDSVYRWRASGRDLDALHDQPGAAVTVSIQILF